MDKPVLCQLRHTLSSLLQRVYLKKKEGLDWSQNLYLGASDYGLVVLFLSGEYKKWLEILKGYFVNQKNGELSKIEHFQHSELIFEVKNQLR